jgi:hypothetical protein
LDYIERDTSGSPKTTHRWSWRHLAEIAQGGKQDHLKQTPAIAKRKLTMPIRPLKSQRTGEHVC